MVNEGLLRCLGRCMGEGRVVWLVDADGHKGMKGEKPLPLTQPWRFGGWPCAQQAQDRRFRGRAMMEIGTRTYLKDCTPVLPRRTGRQPAVQTLVCRQKRTGMTV